VAGYLLSFEPPSTLHTSLALRQGIWRKDDPRWNICGIPDVLYTDHGSDFTSRHLEQVSADLKIRLVFSTPGKPRGRGRIERFFTTVDEMFLCELDGYAPPGGRWPGQKPQKTNCRPAQCTPSAPWPPQKIIEVVALIRVRFGVTVIGLGHQGFRFTGVPNAHTA
jgi:transposase InsO family protein